MSRIWLAPAGANTWLPFTTAGAPSTLAEMTPVPRLHVNVAHIGRCGWVNVDRHGAGSFVVAELVAELGAEDGGSVPYGNGLSASQPMGHNPGR